MLLFDMPLRIINMPRLIAGMLETILYITNTISTIELHPDFINPTDYLVSYNEKYLVAKSVV